MIDAIVYSSLSGSCEEYAHRMSAALHVPFFTEQSHICPTGRKVVYIGWLLAGKVVGLGKAKERYNVVGVVSVGMGAPAANAEEVCRKKNGLGADVAVFPLQGRFDLKRLPLPYRLIMKVKIKDIAKRLNAKAAKTTLTPAEQACLTMATVGRGEPATWDGIKAAIDWVEANSFHSKFPDITGHRCLFDYHQSAYCIRIPVNVFDLRKINAEPAGHPVFDSCDLFLCLNSKVRQISDLCIDPGWNIWI